jgi:hypothetical protein
MPSQDRVGLDHARQSNQAWPQPRHQYQQSSVTGAQPQTMRRTPQGNIELVPQKQVLDFNPAPRPERVGDKHHKQMTECKHHVE